MSNKYTFDNLVNMVVKAVRDGKLDRVELCKHHLSARSFTDGGSRIEHFNVSVRSDERTVSRYIKFIESLYTETFVIENEDDIKKVRFGDEITLANGSSFAANHVSKISRGWVVDSILGHLNQKYCLFTLKGATVTRFKGDE